MNGRIYDPLLGRFLSADPNITYPANLQSYNRYSYVLNNPLTYFDLNGYDPTVAQPGSKEYNAAIAIKQELVATSQVTKKGLFGKSKPTQGAKNAQAMLGRLQSGDTEVLVFNGGVHQAFIDKNGEVVQLSTDSGPGKSLVDLKNNQAKVGLDITVDPDKQGTVLAEEVRETSPENTSLGSRVDRETDSKTFAEEYAISAGAPPVDSHPGTISGMSESQALAAGASPQDAQRVGQAVANKLGATTANTDIFSTRTADGKSVNTVYLGMIVSGMHGGARTAGSSATGTGMQNTTTTSTADLTTDLRDKNGDEGVLIPSDLWNR